MMGAGLNLQLCRHDSTARHADRLMSLGGAGHGSAVGRSKEDFCQCL